MTKKINEISKKRSRHFAGKKQEKQSVNEVDFALK